MTEVSVEVLHRAILGLAAHGDRTVHGPAIDIEAEIAALGAALRGDVDRAWSHIDWSGLLGAEAGLAFRMLAPGVDDDEREALRGILSGFASSPFVGAPGRVRVLTLRSTAYDVGTAGKVLRDGDHAAVVTGYAPNLVGGVQAVLTLLEIDPAGMFGPLDYASLQGRGAPGFGARLSALMGQIPEPSIGAVDVVVVGERRPSGWADGGRLDDLLRRFEVEGPPPARPEAAARLAALTGLTNDEAARLLAGAPTPSLSIDDLVTRHLFYTLGVDTDDGTSESGALAHLPAATLVALLDAAMPEDPADLWTDGPDVDGLAAAWPR